jgi:hypothetical protein
MPGLAPKPGVDDRSRLIAFLEGEALSEDAVKRLAKVEQALSTSWAHRLLHGNGTVNRNKGIANAAVPKRAT